jgi:hypothetical protein
MSKKTILKPLELKEDLLFGKKIYNNNNKRF